MKRIASLLSATIALSTVSTAAEPANNNGPDATLPPLARKATTSLSNPYFIIGKAVERAVLIKEIKDELLYINILRIAYGKSDPALDYALERGNVYLPKKEIEIFLELKQYHVEREGKNTISAKQIDRYISLSLKNMKNKNAVETSLEVILEPKFDEKLIGGEAKNPPVYNNIREDYLYFLLDQPRYTTLRDEFNKFLDGYEPPPLEQTKGLANSMPSILQDLFRP